MATLPVNNMVPQQAPPSCPAGCCTGNEILCVSIPCPINIVLLGLDLTLELPCLRLTSTSALTSQQVNSILQTISTLLGGLGTGISA